MRLPNICRAIYIYGRISNTEKKLFPSGDVENLSTSNIWVTADGQKHCLKPGESTDSVGVFDGDGILLDGRDVLFDSVRSDLGGGQVHSSGAIKVCNLGTLTIHDSPTVSPGLIARISTPGFVCPGDSAGYKTPQWCSLNSGWDINTAPTARQC